MCEDLVPESVVDSVGASLRRSLDADVGFVGLVDDDATLTLGSVAGGRVGALDGMRVESGNGLGGQVLATETPASVEDYVRSTEITHEHDAEVEREGVRGLVSVPLVVAGDVLGVAYVGFRRPFEFTDRAISEVMTVVESASVAMTLAERARTMRDEAARSAREAAMNDVRDALDPQLAALVDGIRDIVGDPAADPTIVEKASRLLGQTIRTRAAIGEDLPAPEREAAPSPLTPRETEVIRLAATGATNAQIAESLFLAHGTVKAYMESVLHKLGARNRVEAAMIAAGLDLL